jgi:hypothetical protein
MSVEAGSSVAAEHEQEIARLRERVASLECQLLETESWANRVVAEAQDRTYWLDRFHVDLDALARRIGTDRVERLARCARAVYRTAKSFGQQRRS